MVNKMGIETENIILYSQNKMSINLIKNTKN